MKRRKFLKVAAASPLLVQFGCRRTKKTKRTKTAAATQSAPCVVSHEDRAGARVLNPREWSTLEAVCARILPTDDTPGATEAHVINFIDFQLTTPLVAPFLPAFRRLARMLHARARKAGVGSFAALPEATQDRLLENIQSAHVGRVSGARVFRALVSLVLEGTFGDPIYGGNRDKLGWKLIGFTPQQPGPTCPYTGRL